jgi:hypothetical protein
MKTLSANFESAIALQSFFLRQLGPNPAGVNKQTEETKVT